MRYAGIVHSDIANGPGMRVSVFVSGCRNACPGCFNQEAQSFDYGIPFTQDSIDTIVRALEPEHVHGLTVLGGEPLEPENQPMVLRLLQSARLRHKDKDVWLYTGFTFEELTSGASRAESPYLPWILENVDVLVDGPFHIEERDPSLAFRGSANQRLIDLAAMRASDDPSKIIQYVLEPGHTARPISKVGE